MLLYAPPLAISGECGMQQVNAVRVLRSIERGLLRYLMEPPFVLISGAAGGDASGQSRIVPFE